ncbi:hypothetical protein QWE_18323 [Agrobacterium albertimagni AOL15]|uniref:DUF4365 domain-containing protein n=1 Tax=Agrobacterium albertimagni AOL15 TaxID=1156935 RepID=K2PCH4_9HYPH|nr:DUF4365 domain-containing protein [Agrobacterium albertimagni]EKF58583.1 hypothetical protein QWE_18323 [Agrobacterium albertimagni AOL15]
MDSLLAATDIEEALSTAYVHAVAAAAGYVVALRNFDRDGIDVTIEAGGGFRPKIDAQVKATINLTKSEDVWKFPLKRRNYDHLIIQTQTPRILVVMHLPSEQVDWVNVGIDCLILRNCAYWVCLTGSPASANSTTVTVDVPSNNRFDVPGLVRLLEMSRTGTLR